MATDSSYVIPGDASLPSQPVDAAGGAPANYGSQILDLFKFGIGAATSLKAQQISANATSTPAVTANGQTSLAGQKSGVTASGIATPVSGMSMTTMLLIGGGLLVAAIVLKKVL